ncbi:MAG: cytochrome P450 [Nostoc sp.]|uniref:cytochrome P450 n=1 Tax=Nostoc sp. TaxID=1180 RepID=UPI002FF0DC89
MKSIANTNQDVIDPSKNKESEAKKPLKFNPFDPEFRANPYPTYHQLRSQSPIHKTSSFTGNEWLLTRFADVKAVLSDSRFGVDDLPERLNQKSLYLKQQTEFQALSLTISKWLFFLNPPDHTRLRGLVGKSFSPGNLEGMRPQVQKTVDKLLDKVQETGTMDIISDLACPLPAIVTSSILGMSTEGISQLTQWAHDLFRVFDQPMSLENYQYLNRIALEFREYFSSLIAEREKNPQEDLICNMIAVQKQSGDLNYDELIAFCAMLFSVGQDTTENLLGNSFLALLNHPEQLQKLKQEPTMIANAVEELLRYDSPVQLLARVAMEDVEIDGNLIRAGERVHISLGAANRDPSQFPNPDALDFSRQKHGMPFGAGMHYCLGSTLARIQGQVAINTVVQRLSNLKLNTDRLEWRKNIVLRGMKSLPVTFTL